ncbi:MAG TPA: SPW repeat protein [Stellaceae bacterium]|nr:SPW repeat protein [Stellaceae bacterium]
MAQTGYGGSVPRRWQDWSNLVLGVWLFISPWLLGFAISAGVGSGAAPAATGAVSAATWDAWIFGVLTVIVTLWTMAQFAAWQEWLSLLIGIWLFVAPWVLRFSSLRNAAWDHWIVGVLIFLVSVSALSYARAPTASLGHAGDKPRDRI